MTAEALGQRALRRRALLSWQGKARAALQHRHQLQVAGEHHGARMLRACLLAWQQYAHQLAEIGLELSSASSSDESLPAAPAQAAEAGAQPWQAGSRASSRASHRQPAAARAASLSAGRASSRSPSAHSGSDASPSCSPRSLLPSAQRGAPGVASAAAALWRPQLRSHASSAQASPDPASPQQGHRRSRAAAPAQAPPGAGVSRLPAEAVRALQEAARVKRVARRALLLRALKAWRGALQVRGRGAGRGGWAPAGVPHALRQALHQGHADTHCCRPACRPGRRPCRPCSAPSSALTACCSRPPGVAGAC